MIVQQVDSVLEICGLKYDVSSYLLQSDREPELNGCGVVENGRQVVDLHVDSVLVLHHPDEIVHVHLRQSPVAYDFAADVDAHVKLVRRVLCLLTQQHASQVLVIVVNAVFRLAEIQHVVVVRNLSCHRIQFIHQ
jgi:hypothetical protein